MAEVDLLSRKTILFLDEVHRFNRSQQVLPLSLAEGLSLACMSTSGIICLCSPSGVPGKTFPITLRSPYFDILHFSQLQDLPPSLQIMAEVPFEQRQSFQDSISATTTANQKKLAPQSQRQLLSCTKCRERKVKV